MRIAIIGCGGIGGVFAANLLRAGADVTPVVRTPQLAETLTREGLCVRELDGTSWKVRSPRPALVDLAEADPGFDLAILATQSTALEAALRGALPHLAEDAAIVTCQNGLPEERARAIVAAAGGDAHRVVGCVVGFGASMVLPGVYERTSRGGLQLGGDKEAEADGRRLEALAALLHPVAEAQVVPDLAGVRWSKLAINCVTTTLGAIGGLPLGRLLVLRYVRRLALEIFSEVAAVAQASAIQVKPVGGTFELAAVSITPEERARPLGSPSLAYKHSLLLAVGFKYRKLRSSMLYALERGRPLEIEQLNGEIVRRGAALGVPTPVNSALCDAVRALGRGEMRPELAQLRRLHDLVLLESAGRLAA